MVLLARLVPPWRDAVLLVRPATILRWHREGFRLFWRWKSKPESRKPNLSAENIALIRQIVRFTEEGDVFVDGDPMEAKVRRSRSS
jgi:hypothetical protein